MLELLTGPLGLVLTAAVLWWGITFNSRLEKRYHCTACTPWGIAGGVAAAITLGLFFSNRAKSGSVLQGVLMTVWQLFLGLVVFGILEMLDNWRKRRK